MVKFYIKLNRKNIVRLVALATVSVLLSSTSLIFLGTDEAAAATSDCSYSISKYYTEKTLVKNPYGRTVYTSSYSNTAIQWAIDHSSAGKTIMIKAGTYDLTGAVKMKSGVTVMGVGDRTILKNGEIDSFVSNVAIKSLRLLGTCHILIASKTEAVSNVVVQEVSATTGVCPAVFAVNANDYAVSNVQFIGDVVMDSSSYGFKLNGTGDISNVYFDSCKAIRSGLSARPDSWVTGFVLDGTGNQVSNVMLYRCEASYSWENGFYISPWIDKVGVVLQECTASYNGQNPSCQEGFGYVLDSTVSLLNSNGVGNKGGLTNLEEVPPPVEEPDQVDTAISTEIAINLPSSSVATGTSVTATGALRGSASTGSVPISGAVVHLSVTLPDGSIVLPVEGSSVTTNANGEFTVTYTPLSAGTVKYSAVYSGDEGHEGSSVSKSFTAVAPAPQKSSTSISLTMASSSVEAGKSIHADGVLTGTSAVSGATISLQVTLPSGATAYPTQGATTTTDSSGRFSMDYVPSVAGSYRFTASYSGSSVYLSSSASAAWTAVAPPTPTTTPTHDYSVSSSVVKTSSGATAYTGSTFTAALNWACTQANKAVYVPAGQYYLSSNINFASGVTLVGDGPTATVFTFTDTTIDNSDYSDASFHPVNVDNVVLKQFGITGEGCIWFSVTSGTHGNNKVEDVWVYDTNNLQVNAFGSWVSTGATVSGMQFIRCIAYNVGGNGFALMGNFPWNNQHGTQKNIYFEDCKALYCGYTTTIWDWTVGFDLAEQCNVNGVTCVRCEASYNWESGFHLEYSPTCANVKFQDCVANYNGQTYSDPRGAVWGCGFLYFEGVTRTNCTGTGNAGGTVYAGDLYSYDQKSVSGYTYLVSGTSVKNSAGSTVYTGSTFTAALQWACSKENAVVKIPAGTYSVTGRITLANGVCLYGGIDLQEWFATPGSSTTLNFPGTSANEGFYIHNVNNVRMNLLIINKGNIEIAADGGSTVSNIKLRGIDINQASYLHPAAINTYCASGSTIDGLDMGACDIVNAHADGFRFSGAGSGTNAMVKNLKMLFCKAENSGQTSPRYGDSVGFRFGDGVNIQTASVTECTARYSYCSGFYFTAGSTVSGVTLKDCVASNNGQKGDASNGAGYYLNGYSVITTGCTGISNFGPLVQK